MIEFVKKEEVKTEKGDTPRITFANGETSREFVAELVKCEPFQSKDHPDWAPSIKFIFRVLEEPFVGAFSSGLVNNNWTPGNKLDKWLKALGVDASIGDKLSSEQIKKAVVRIRVELDKNGYANVKGLEPMIDRDWVRVAPEAQKPKSTQVHQVTTQTQQASNIVTPLTSPVQQVLPPKITVTHADISKDDTIPF